MELARRRGALLDGSDEEDYRPLAPDSADRRGPGENRRRARHRRRRRPALLPRRRAAPSASSSWASAPPTPTALRSATTNPASSWAAGDGGMFADPMTLQPGEAQQVARRLHEVLTRESASVARLESATAGPAFTEAGSPRAPSYRRSPCDPLVYRVVCNQAIVDDRAK